jgi:hypothetical protein
VIVEAFGPPGAGKTTFSHALAARLRETGCTVDVYLSARPGEERPGPMSRGDTVAALNLMAPLRRLTRPAIELIAAIAANPLARESSTDALVSKLPGGRGAAALR